MAKRKGVPSASARTVLVLANELREFEKAAARIRAVIRALTEQNGIALCSPSQ